MKICKQIEKFIPLYSSGDLEPADKMKVESHLAECPACRAYLREIQSLQKLLLPEEVVIDSHYSAQLVVNLQNSIQHRARRRRKLYYLVPAFSSLAVIAILTFNLISSNSLSRQYAENSTAVDLYVDLTHSGFFTETPEIVFDQLDESANKAIAEEIQQHLREDLISDDIAVPVDNYIVATAHLSDQDFRSLLKTVEEFTL
jgi:predicted anti-sigma-YlaC factor YlaD